MCTHTSTLAASTEWFRGSGYFLSLPALLLSDRVYDVQVKMMSLTDGVILCKIKKSIWLLWSQVWIYRRCKFTEVWCGGDASALSPQVEDIRLPQDGNVEPLQEEGGCVFVHVCTWMCVLIRCTACPDVGENGGEGIDEIAWFFSWCKGLSSAAHQRPAALRQKKLFLDQYCAFLFTCLPQGQECQPWLCCWKGTPKTLRNVLSTSPPFTKINKEINCRLLWKIQIDGFPERVIAE